MSVSQNIVQKYLHQKHLGSLLKMQTSVNETLQSPITSIWKHHQISSPSNFDTSFF